MKRIILFLILLIFTFLVAEGQVQEETPVPQALFTPGNYQEMLCAQRCFRQTVNVRLPARNVTVVNQLDLVILIDNSSSMDDVISAAQRGSQQIVEGVRNLLSDTRFAIGSFSDYVDVPWRLYTNFSTSLSAIEGGVNTIELLNGGDTPETYGRALWEVSRLDWRPNAAKVIIIFSDASAKDPDPGPDGNYGSGDDLDYASVLDELAEKDIRVIGVNSGGFFSNESLQQAADATNGMYFDLEDVNTIPETLINLLRGLLDTYRLRFTPQDAAQANWFSQTPASFEYPVDGVPVAVDLGFCPFEHNLSSGNYSVRMDLDSGGTSYGTVPITIDYYTECVALNIADSASDDGTQCSTGAYWESPAIEIRPPPGAASTLQNSMTGVPSDIYVQIVNREPLTTSDAVLSVYASPSLLVGDFPADWTLLGEQSITLQPNDTQWFGPFRWTPESEVVALRAEVHDANDNTTQPNNVRCESNIAQVNRTSLRLDTYSIVPNNVAAAMSLGARLPSDQDSLDLVVDGAQLTSDGVLMVRSSDAEGEVSQPISSGSLIVRDFLRQLVPSVNRGRLIIGASAPVTDGRVYLTLNSGGETFAGATVKVSSEPPLRNAPPDDPKKPTDEIPTEVYTVAIGILGVLFLIAVVLAMLPRREIDDLPGSS